MRGDTTVASGYAEVLRHRIQQGGALWFVTRSLRWLWRNGCWLLLLPLACLLHCAGFRRLTIQTARIGHLTSEPDCFLKLKALGRLPHRRWFVLAPLDRVCNPHLLGYWQPHLHFVTHPMACRLLAMLSLRGPMVHSVSDYILSFDAGAEYYRVNRDWGHRPPLLALSSDDRQHLPDLLTGLGLPPGAWYVCFHNREGGYSPLDEVIHAHRNARISNYQAAMAYVVAQGGWCIRMGDPSMEKLPPLPQVIDYAHHPLRSGRADLLLCASCRFFVGSSSGLWNLSSVFGVRSALANMIPVSTLGYAVGDLSIPKLLQRDGAADAMHFKDVFESGLANLRTASAYRAASVRVIENSSDDILELVTEMHAEVSGNAASSTEETQSQAAFRALMGPKDYGYHAVSRIGDKFTNKYRKLISKNTAPMEEHEEILVFLHIAKTGGTTLGNILGNIYPVSQQLSAHVGQTDSALGVWPHEPFRLAWSALSDQRKSEIRHVAGHSLFGIHRALDRPCRYVAMLRDPIDRVASSYYYIATQPGIPVYRDIVNGGGIEDYIRSRKGLDPHNYQTRILCGDEAYNATWAQVEHVLSQPMPLAALETAKQNLDHHFMVVGPVEEFDKVLMLLKIRLAKPLHKFLYEKKNVNSERPSLGSLNVQAIDAIRSANSLDMALYDFAKARFDRDCQPWAPLMEALLPEFQKLLIQYRYIQVKPDRKIESDILSRCVELDNLCNEHCKQGRYS